MVKKLQETGLIISKVEFESMLQERISIGENILAFKVNTQSEFDKNKDEYYSWTDYNSEFLKQSFNNENNEYRESYNKAGIAAVRIIGNSPSSTNQKALEFKKKIESKVKNLQKLKTKLHLLKCTIDEKLIETKMQKIKNTNNKVFIVHGHDDNTKVNIARTLEKLGLEPIILHEQPNAGRTIIEKFEANADVGFAVVLLTCDDLGKVKSSDEENFRARQNVILEMGYFIGRLGRDRVFPLYESNVELPSDLSGIVYNSLDESGKWTFALVKELKNVGYEVDANKLL